MDPNVYAAWTKDDKIRFDSTSGGIYYELASYFINSGGYIVGCVFSDDYKSAKHVVGRTYKDLQAIMGSKYFQSDTAGIYKRVLELLKRNERVLFCGTPCQVAALRAYLGREYENLYLLDFICKGINSPKSDVLKFMLEGNCSVVVRPSGTEPKLKTYISVSAVDRETAEKEEQIICDELAGKFM